jgi:hypothetical protein
MDNLDSKGKLAQYLKIFMQKIKKYQGRDLLDILSLSLSLSLSKDIAK